MENKKIYLITFIAANGGLLYGLNMAGISGCVDSIQQIFGLSSNSIGLAVSILTLGCLVGSFFVGQLADIISRRGVFILSAIIMALTSLGLFYAQSIVWVYCIALYFGISGRGGIGGFAYVHFRNFALRQARNIGFL